MSDLTPGLNLAEIDPEGALNESIASGVSRSGFLRGLLALTAGAATVVAADQAFGAISRTGDSAILNPLLIIECMQAEFYRRAADSGQLPANYARLANEIAAIEAAHVAGLKNALGGAANDDPYLNFRGTTENPMRFIRTAVALEDLSTSTLAGVMDDFESEDNLTTVAAIYTAEARHSAGVRLAAGEHPAPSPVQKWESLPKVRKLLNETGFLTPKPTTVARQSPAFTG
ncbi:MAG: ferritin-like domain-containing protein [Thermoleophilia bacterium]|nr:ferritin-like domain-containing protein [Thermoleophilia bacterium]MDH3725351.1 ferritin-like domain-containing protein [Thermoleophilia bacterium]